MFSKVVYATSLSDTSRRVAESLEGLRTVGTREIVLVHAMDLRGVGALYDQLKGAAEKELAKQKEVLEAAGFDVSLELRLGLPYNEILEAAHEHQASLIAVHTTAGSRAGELFRGGVAHEVVNKSTAPMLVLRVLGVDEETDRPGEVICEDYCAHVLYPTDFSDTAERALAWVEHLVEAGRPRVTLMHVQDRSRIQHHLEHKLGEFNRIDSERLEAVKARLQAKGEVEVDYELFYGSPPQEILRQAQEYDYSLIVMGSQGRGFIQEVFLGSVSHKVMSYAPAPVLLIPAERG
ncbi:MAG: universal stress protein [Candidatus Hydrogenedentota bacterium]